MRKRTLLATAFSVCAAVGLTHPAAASDEWCEADPPVQLTLPDGTKTIVFVVDAGPEKYRDLIKRPAITYAISDGRNGSARVELRVVIPTAGSAAFPVRSRVWTNPGQQGALLSELFGNAGETLAHSFTLGQQ